MSVFVDVVNAVTSVGQTVSDFLTTGIYTYTVKAFAFLVKWLTVAFWTIKLMVLNFSYDVAQELILSLNLSETLDFAWGALESRTLSMLTFFRVPEAVNMVLSASITKFVFRMMGF